MGPDETQIYESFIYSDPVNQEYDPPILFDTADPAGRTIRYCATYNNGVAADGTPDVRLFDAALDDARPARRAGPWPNDFLDD